jgi:hypothetical protein
VFQRWIFQNVSNMNYIIILLAIFIDTNDSHWRVPDDAWNEPDGADLSVRVNVSGGALGRSVDLDNVLHALEKQLNCSTNRETS